MRLLLAGAAGRLSPARAEVVLADVFARQITSLIKKTFNHR